MPSTPLFLRVLIIIALTATVSSCSHYRATPAGGVPTEGRAIVIFGVDPVGGDVAVAFASLAERRCRDDINARAKAGDSVRYVSFEVPPGEYAVSGFHTSGRAQNPDPAAFVVPANSTVFLGLFSRVPAAERAVSPIVTDDRMPSVSRDLEPVRAQFGPDVRLAEVHSMDVRLTTSTYCIN